MLTAVNAQPIIDENVTEVQPEEFSPRVRELLLAQPLNPLVKLVFFPHKPKRDDD